MVVSMGMASFFNSISRAIFGTSTSFRLENGDKVTVWENNTEKKLIYDGYTYSKIPKKGIFTHEYWDYLLPLAYIHNNSKILLIGLGGGTVPWQLSMLDCSARITAVESSKKVVEIEGMFTGALQNLSTIVGDGAEYVANASEKYNIIILDAYVSRSIPSEFLNSKFVEDSYRALTEDGILAVNYITDLDLHRYLQLLETRYKVFLVSTSALSANSIIIASKSFGKQEILRQAMAGMPGMLGNEESSFIIDAYARMLEE